MLWRRSRRPGARLEKNRRRAPGESFRAWAWRTGDQTIIRRFYGFAPATREEDDLFIDWGDQEIYSLKLGRGECAT